VIVSPSLEPGTDGEAGLFPRGWSLSVVEPVPEPCEGPPKAEGVTELRLQPNATIGWFLSRFIVPSSV